MTSTGLRIDLWETRARRAAAGVCSVGPGRNCAFHIPQPRLPGPRPLNSYAAGDAFCAPPASRPLQLQDVALGIEFFLNRDGQDG